MKILLTAPPGTGKSTVIQKFIALAPVPLAGIYAQEIRNDQTKPN